jgi:outer membrane biosynthesis protein TonB
VKPPKKAIAKTKPKTKAKVKPTTKAVPKPMANKKPKVKPAFNLKGIPAPFKWICTLAINNAATQTECDELVLVGINAFETLRETETSETAAKTEVQVVTQAILTKKATYKTTE